MISETEKSPKFLTSETTFTEPRKRNLRMEANMRRQNLQRTEIKDEKRGEKEMAKDVSLLTMKSTGILPCRSLGGQYLTFKNMVFN